MPDNRGLTLLEVMVALVILGLVGLSYLELFSQSHRVVGSSRQWSMAVEYAEDAVEDIKLRGVPANPVQEHLPGGYVRRISATTWRPGLTAVEVTVELPGGARFDVERLVQLEPSLPRGTSAEEDPS
ncbi:MAG: ral secretion pathway protein [Gemmatimonadales bacterium]|jgi:prepilin-type N-terminal cleavage/methylation domain-containing protein|nr:ral secretion pathway protein [Gemmatimonadales bacterium]